MIRGPVLGPMVYGAAYTSKNYAEKLKETFGVDDSKKLKAEERENIQKEMLKKSNFIKHNLRIIDACELSTKMLRRDKYNLNLISHDACIELIKISKKQIEDAKGVLVHVYIDTVGDPQKYQEKVENEFPGVNITVSKKADSLFPIVSAASIFAKVARDDIIEKFGKDIGSGYPSDPNTTRWIEKNKDPVFGFKSNLVRFSWSTISKIINDKVLVEWSDDEDDERVSSKQNFSIYGKERATYFEQKNLKRAKLSDFGL